MMSYFGGPKAVSDVFGISPEILNDSYVDRGLLDAEIAKQLRRSNHIALRGESKCGKSWIRKKNIPDAIVVQCRLGKSSASIYRDILASLGINIKVEENTTNTLAGNVEASSDFGTKLLTKVALKLGFQFQRATSGKYEVIGSHPSDIQFVCEMVKESGKRIVIEDFHYMSISERKSFAFDLKTMWDYGTFVIIVGVWSQSNMLIYLNPDLSGRIEEISIYWSDSDLEKILLQGGQALGLRFSSDVKSKLVQDSFGNAGILQKLTLNYLDEKKVEYSQNPTLELQDLASVDAAGMRYAEQLNPVYQQFAQRVSTGIRKRADATGIYAHAMAVIMSADDEKLKSGLSLNEIHVLAHSRQSRIQKGNLRTVLDKFERLQVDEEGRGLVLAFNEATDEVLIVDRQLLLYRKYATVKWPWENMIIECDQTDKGFDADNET